MDLLRAQHAALLEDLLLLGCQGRALDRLVAAVRLVLARGELDDLLRDPHAAPVVAAHRAEVGVDVEVFVVIRPRGVGIEGELEVLLPVEGGAGLGELVVAVAHARDAERDVRRMRRDLVGDAALLDVVALGKAQVLLRRHIAEHACAVVGRRGRADAARDVVVAREDVGDERAEHVEGRAVAEPPLQLHVELDLIEGHVSRAFDHDLHAVPPRPLGEFAEGLELGELRRVGRVGEPAGTQAVADREGDVVAAQDLADLVPHRVHQVLAVVDDHPLRQQAPAATHDADQAPLDERQMRLPHAGVDREVVDALLRLMLERVEHDLLVEILDLPPDDHRVDRHRPDRGGRVLAERRAARVEIAAGREIHDRVGAPLDRPVELLELFMRSRGDRRRAHVRVDLGLGRAADRHRIEAVLQVVDVCRDHQASGGDLVAHEFRGEMRLALGDPDHLRGDDPKPCRLELGDRREALGIDDASPLAPGRAELDGRLRLAAA